MRAVGDVSAAGVAWVELELLGAAVDASVPAELEEVSGDAAVPVDPELAWKAVVPWVTPVCEVSVV